MKYFIKYLYSVVKSIIRQMFLIYGFINLIISGFISNSDDETENNYSEYILLMLIKIFI